MQSISPVLEVRDMDATISYYREVLGFPEAEVLRMPNGTAVHGMARRGSVMLQFSPEESSHDHAAPRGNGVIFYIHVGPDETVDAYYESVVHAGADLAEELGTKPWGDRTFTAVDPDGYRLMFAQTVQGLASTTCVGPWPTRPSRARRH